MRERARMRERVRALTLEQCSPRREHVHVTLSRMSSYDTASPRLPPHQIKAEKLDAAALLPPHPFLCPILKVLFQSAFSELLLRHIHVCVHVHVCVCVCLCVCVCVCTL